MFGIAHNNNIGGTLIKIYNKMTEKQLHKQITDYLKYQYKKVIFTTDMSGIRLTQGQAVQTSKLRSSAGIPDILIFQTGGKILIWNEDEKINQVVFQFAGLFLEVKKETPYKKNGEVLKKHLHQAEIHKRLRKQGYYAIFVWSFDEAKKIIDDYLNE